MLEVPNILFVAWQDQDYAYHPVGRLVRTHGGTDTRFEFAYIHGAITARDSSGFRPFMAFPDFNRVYRSRDLFPFFTNRLMQPSRPDYAAYIGNLGLDPSMADPFAILARSGGGRATDSIEVFPYPTFSPEIGYETIFCAHGVRWLPEFVREHILTLQPNQPLLIMMDCQNPVDPNAIALRTENKIMVGYIPGYLLADAATLRQSCPFDSHTIKVLRANTPPATLQQRLVCHLAICCPDNFVPYSTETYQPIAPAAAPVEGGTHVRIGAPAA